VGGWGRVLSASEPVSGVPWSVAASPPDGWVQEGPWAAFGGVQAGVASGVAGGWLGLSVAAGGWVQVRPLSEAAGSRPQDEGDSPQDGGQVSSAGLGAWSFGVAAVAGGGDSGPDGRGPAPAGPVLASASRGSGWVWVWESGERDGSRPSRMDIGRLLRSNMASLVVDEARRPALKHQ
jgi:hypothetical protein